jgi:hypothetical protein
MHALTILQGRGHHLADPDQWHDLFSRTHARSCRSGSATSVPPTRPRFSLKGRGLTPIRASHPSGSRRWGCSVGSRHPAPGSLEPQKIVGTPPRSGTCQPVLDTGDKS